MVKVFVVGKQGKLQRATKKRLDSLKTSNGYKPTENTVNTLLQIKEKPSATK